MFTLFTTVQGSKELSLHKHIISFMCIYQYVVNFLYVMWDFLHVITFVHNLSIRAISCPFELIEERKLKYNHVTQLKIFHLLVYIET